jgi:hypothetical protein
MILLVCYGWDVDLSEVLRLSMITIPLGDDLWKVTNDVTRPG